MPKFRITQNGTAIFTCLGCNEEHSIPVREVKGINRQHTWGYNENIEAPTLTPSILIKNGHYATHYKKGEPCWCTYADEHDGEEPFKCGICHSFITDGHIKYLNDCTHKLAGQTIELPDMVE